MSIEQAKAGIASAEQSAGQALSALQGAKSMLDQAAGTLQTATQGSSQASTDQAIAHYQQAKTKIDEAMNLVQAAVQAAQQYSSSI